MKRSIPLLLLIPLLSLAVLLGVFLGRQTAPAADAAETSVPSAAPIKPPTPAPTSTAVPEPDWEPGYIRLGDWGLLWCTFTRGDEVNILGRTEDCYIIEGAEADLLVSERLVRAEGEVPPAPWNGWARDNTPVYSSAYLFGTPQAHLSLNTPVQVIDGKSGWVFIRWDGGEGYADPTRISREYMTPTYSGGGSTPGGGYIPGGGTLPPVDGTDVSLGDLALQRAPSLRAEKLGTYCGPEYEPLFCRGTILSHETEAYLCFLRRPDSLKVTQAGTDSCRIYLNGLSAELPRWTVRMESEEEYAPWLAYTKAGSVAYREYQRKNTLASFSRNDRVWVVDELAELDLYVVEIDGVFGYMRKTDLDRSAFAAPAAPGGGGGGGGIPVSPIDPAPGGGSPWTPPNL